MIIRTPSTIPTPGHRGPGAAPIRRALLLGALLAGLLYVAFQPAPTHAAVWVRERSFTTSGLAAVSCVSTTFCRAGGEDGTIVNYIGTGWHVYPPLPGGVIWDLDCASPTFCKAVIPGSAVVGRHGASWTVDRTAMGTFAPDATAVSCVSARFCKAVGAKGTILSLAPNPPTATREVPVVVECAGTGRACDEPTPFELILPARGVRNVRFVASPTACSDIRVTLSVIYRPLQSGFIQLFPTLAESTFPFLAPGGGTEELVLDNRLDRPGDYILTVTAEGREGGCYTGRLERFGGTLIVTISE